MTRYMEMRGGIPNGFAVPDLEGMEEEDWLEDKRTGYVKVKRMEMREVPRPEEITIYGYPSRVFPPTDGHVAVYVRTEDDEQKENIYIVGGVGYPNSVH